VRLDGAPSRSGIASMLVRFSGAHRCGPYHMGPTADVGRAVSVFLACVLGHDGDATQRFRQFVCRANPLELQDTGTVSDMDGGFDRKALP